MFSTKLIALAAMFNALVTFGLPPDGTVLVPPRVVATFDKEVKYQGTVVFPKLDMVYFSTVGSKQDDGKRF